MGVLALLDGLNLEVELQDVTYHPAAGFEGGIPGETEVLSIQLAFGRQPNDLLAVWSRVVAIQRAVQIDFTGNAVNRQVAVHLELVIAEVLDTGALIEDLRM